MHSVNAEAKKHITNRQLLELFETCWQFRWVWVSTTAAFTLLGLFYVLFLKSDVWVASQGLIVRDEANGSIVRLGRFQSQSDMKAAQETVLEMSRNTQVLHSALSSVGRAPKWFGLIRDTEPPTQAEIEKLGKDLLEVRAPRGAELGTTEVIYLDIKDTSQSRALNLNRAVCLALENQLANVRQTRAVGVIEELTTARDAAARALDKATHRMQLIEASVGADLSDLRGMTDSNSNGNNNRMVLDGIRTEIRQVELRLNQLETDVKLTQESFENPDHLLVAPSSLTSEQSGLRKLREGLAQAKINLAELRGRFTDKNPVVVDAAKTESHIREQLREELRLAIQALAKDVEVAANQLGKLRSQERELETRLKKLAEVRADYANVAAEVKARSQELQDIERDMSQVAAARDSAFTSSLVTRLDEPIVGEKPIGPGRSTIVAGTTVGGLLLGLGIVFLLKPLESRVNYGRRRYDYSDNDRRRATDRAGLGSSAQLAAAAESPLLKPRERREPVQAASIPEHEIESAPGGEPSITSAASELNLNESIPSTEDLDVGADGIAYQPADAEPQEAERVRQTITASASGASFSQLVSQVVSERSTPRERVPLPVASPVACEQRDVLDEQLGVSADPTTSEEEQKATARGSGINLGAQDVITHALQATSLGREVSAQG